MASQTCEQCGSIAAGDEQFCPSCGAFMDPMSASPSRPQPSRGQDNVISVSSDGPTQDSPYEEFSLESGPPQDDVPPPPDQDPPPGGGNGNGGGGPIQCPSCGAVNPGNNRHCQECGARLRQGPLPTAPRPAVQATAGVRAALAIGSILLAVIVIALLFNIFTGDDPEATASTTTTSTTAPQILETGPLEILNENCTPEGIGSFSCTNLTSGTTDEYQVSWEENANEGVTIELSFRQPMAIEQILWTNIDDEVRFHQNWRAQSLTVEAQDSLAGATVVGLNDQQGTQAFQFSALNTTTLTIHVVEAYQAEVREDNVYEEIAIDEIEVIGRPVQAPGTTAPGGTTGTTTPSDTTGTTTPSGTTTPDNTSSTTEG